MKTPRPAKLEPRQYKNTLISSRNQSEVQQSPLNDSNLMKTATFQERTISKQGQNSRNAKPMSSSRKSQADSSSSIHKRLKLKDYMHLNDLEKRHRPKSSSSNPSSEFQRVEKSTQPDHELSRFHVNKKESTPLSSTTVQSSKKIPETNTYSAMIREEIAAKIQRERCKLNDLQAYLKQDFTPKENPTETFVFLFNVYNKVNEIHTINEDIGAEVVAYEKKENVQTIKRLAMIKRQSYHWEEGEKELDSPAKIMSNAMKLTFDLASLLNLKK